jgi:hypothetical protein
MEIALELAMEAGGGGLSRRTLPSEDGGGTAGPQHAPHTQTHTHTRTRARARTHTYVLRLVLGHRSEKGATRAHTHTHSCAASRSAGLSRSQATQAGETHL